MIQVNATFSESFQLLRYRHIGTEEARLGTCLAAIRAWAVVVDRAEPDSYTRSE